MNRHQREKRVLGRIEGGMGTDQKKRERLRENRRRHGYRSEEKREIEGESKAASVEIREEREERENS